MELEGRLNSTISLPEIMQFLGMNRMSGSLTVVSGNYNGSLDLREGKLVGSSSLARPRRLGQMLINRGVVNRAAVEEALAYQQDFSPTTPLGLILTQRGSVTESQLRQSIRLQIEEELWELFSLKDGSFKFEHQPEDAPAVEILVELEVEPLILEGTRRMDEWGRIAKNVPGDSVVPSVLKMADTSDRETLHFSDAEWNVLSLIDGYYDMGCITARSGLGRFETFRIMNSFLASGMVELHKPQDDPRDQAAAANGQGVSAAAASEISSTRLGSLLARLRDSEQEKISGRPAAPATRLEFASPVSFVGAICNRILEELLKNPDFVVDPRDERIAERFWRMTLMSFPRADLVSASGNVIRAEAFDRYTATLGVESLLKPIYLETIEALNSYMRMLYTLCAQRLGKKAAGSVFGAIMEDFKTRSTVGHSDNFYFNEFASKALQ